MLEKCKEMKKSLKDRLDGTRRGQSLSKYLCCIVPRIKNLQRVIADRILICRRLISSGIDDGHLGCADQGISLNTFELSQLVMQVSMLHSLILPCPATLKIPA